MAEALAAMLASLEKIRSVEIETVVRGGRARVLYGICGRVAVTVHGTPYTLLVRSEKDGAPRFVSAAAHRLRSYMAGPGKDDPSGEPAVNPVPVICAPFLSPAARMICTELGVSWVDRLGNVMIASGDLYIDISVPTQPPKAPQRRLQSLFGPQGGRVLRVLLSDPGCVWRLAVLAGTAGVSIGHVSAVCRKLRDSDWGSRTREGFRLTNPTALLRAWSEAWAPEMALRVFYSQENREAVASGLGSLLNAQPGRPRLVWRRNSAARWISPFLRQSGEALYADRQGIEALDALPGLARRQSWTDLEVAVPADAEDVFQHVVEPAPGIVCTDALRTFLDMRQGHERESEAAAHLAASSFPWWVNPEEDA